MPLKRQIFPQMLYQGYTNSIHVMNPFQHYTNA